MLTQYFSHLLGERKGTLWKWLLVIVLLSLLFQLVHFGEHIAQAVAWIGGYRNAPYMTALGHYLMHFFGDLFSPYADHAFQEAMGNEILHLIGNFIYSIGAVGMLFFIRTRITIAAAVIEVLHLYEHVCLTLSMAFMGKAVGMSTMWGMAMSKADFVAFRVWWHFLANAIPTILTCIALISIFMLVRRQLRKS